MDLKMIPVKMGEEMQIGFPNLKDINSMPTGSLSSVTYEYVPTVQEEGIAKAKIPVPDVKGYTEIMAKRELESKGFYSEVTFLGVSTDGEVGRVVRQNPTGMSSQELGTIVEIFIGKMIEKGG